MTANGRAGLPFRQPPLQIVARGCIAGLLCVLAPATTLAQVATEKKPFDLNVEVVGTAPIVNDDEAQFQQRHRVPDEVSGGIRRFRYEGEVGDDFKLKFLGRAIFDNHDYLLDLDARKEGVGYLRAGYKQFRTWYDGSGGWFPGNGAFFQVFNPELGLDREEGWIEGGTKLPGDWDLDLRYRFMGRNGDKSSTEWGDTALTGLTVNSRRDIVPAFWHIDEKRHITEGDLTRRSDATLFGAAFRYEAGKIDNRRNIARRPNEAGLDRKLTQRDKYDDDVLTTRAFGEGRFWQDKVIVSGAYAYNDIDLDLTGGSRIYGQTFNAPFDPLAVNRQPNDEGFFNLGGGTKMREHTGNAGVTVRLIEDLNVIASARVRDETMKGMAEFTGTNVGFGPNFTVEEENVLTQNKTDIRSWAESVEARYTGVENLVLYARGDWEQNDGDLFEQASNPETLEVEDARRTNSERNTQAYAVGTKWYPLRKLSLSGEYSYRTRDYDYDHIFDTTPNDDTSGGRYPAYLVSQEFRTHDFNVRATLVLPGAIRLTGRYDYLSTTIDTRADLLDELQTSDMTSHIISGIATWQPMPWMWLRTSLSYVASETDTPVDEMDTPVKQVFPNFDNDYLTANITLGAALDAHTDGELVYHFYVTDNDHDISAFGQPYGADAQEHGVAVRVKRNFTERTSASLGYGYFNNDDGFAGGHYSYDAHIITTSVEFTY